MKDSTIVVIAVILIAVIAVGAYALTLNNSPTPGNTVAAANDNATKLDIKNNDPTNWAGVKWIFNASAQNGTKQTYYLLAFVKPNGNLTIDLSNLLGYGNQPLPAETISINSASGVFNTASGGTGNLNYTLQIWSNTQVPGSGVVKYTANYTTLPVGPIPAETKNAVQALFVSAANEKLGLFEPVSAANTTYVWGTYYKHGDSYFIVSNNGTISLSVDAFLVLMQQLNLTIDPSGNGTIIVTSGPTLCSLF
jgi:hypothetical protein